MLSVSALLSPKRRVKSVATGLQTSGINPSLTALAGSVLQVFTNFHPSHFHTSFYDLKDTFLSMGTINLQVLRKSIWISPHPHKTQNRYQQTPRDNTELDMHPISKYMFQYVSMTHWIDLFIASDPMWIDRWITPLLLQGAENLLEATNYGWMI